MVGGKRVWLLDTGCWIRNVRGNSFAIIRRKVRRRKPEPFDADGAGDSVSGKAEAPHRGLGFAREVGLEVKGVRYQGEQ
jgi:hypothetical protein